MNIENYTEAKHIMEEAIKTAQDLNFTKPYDIATHIMVKLEKKFRLTRKKEKAHGKI